MRMYVLNWFFVSIGVSFLMEIFGVVEGKRDGETTFENPDLDRSLAGHKDRIHCKCSAFQV